MATSLFYFLYGAYSDWREERATIRAFKAMLAGKPAPADPPVARLAALMISHAAAWGYDTIRFLSPSLAVGGFTIRYEWAARPVPYESLPAVLIEPVRQSYLLLHELLAPHIAERIGDMDHSRAEGAFVHEGHRIPFRITTIEPALEAINLRAATRLQQQMEAQINGTPIEEDAPEAPGELRIQILPHA